MATVDEKIVKLTVNNAGFESKLSASASALQKLNQILGRGIGGGAVAADAKQISAGASEASAALSDMEGKTSRLKGAFDTLKIAAGVALGNIATRAIETGARLVSSLSLRPIFDGLAEYNLQMGSVQTILSNTKSKGEDIHSVTAALDELNRYADLTIYNFGEMTSNIGKFTAAGVGLKDSTAAIKGIANMAALSGANSEEASRAMYQLSQALSAGTIKLMDWRSVENASMGGEQLREALMTTARVHGVAVDDMIAKQGSFRDSLSEGWLTSEIFLETMQIMTGDLTEAQIRQMGYSEEQAKMMYELGQTAMHAATEFKTWSDVQDAALESLGSGWATTFRLIFGDYEQSKALWTEVGNAITGAFDRISDARNNFIKAWADLGGRTALIDGLRNAITAMAKPLKAIGQAFGDIFKGPTAESLANATKRFAEFTKSLIISDEAAGKVRRTFAGVFAVFHAGFTIIGQIAKVFATLAGGLIGLFTKLDISKIGDLSAGFGDFLVKIDQAVTKFGLADKILGALSTAFSKLQEKLAPVGDLVRSIADAFKSFGSTIKSNFDTGTLGKSFKKLGESLKSLKDTILGFGKGGDSSAAMQKLGDGAKDAASTLSESAQSAVKSSGIFDKVKEKLSSFVSWLGETVPAALSKAANVLTSAVSKVGEFLGQLGSDFKGGSWSDFGSRALGGVLTLLAGGAIAKAIKGFSAKFAPIEKLSEKITGILNGVADSLKAYQNNLNAKTLMSIALAVGVLAASLLVLSSIDPKKMVTGLGGLAGIMAELAGSMKLLSMSGAGVKASIAGPALLAMATSVLILAGAVKLLASMDTGAVVRGTIAITVFSGVLVASAAALGKVSAKAVVGAGAAVLFAAAINELVLATVILGNMDTSVLIKGGIAIAALATAMALATRALGNAHSIMGAATIASLSASLYAIAGLVAIFGNMDWDTYRDGAIRMGVAIAEMVVAVKLLDGASGLSGAAAIAGLTVSMYGIAGVFKILGGMSWGEMARAAVGMGVALGELVVAVRMLGGVRAGTGAVAILAISAAMMVLSEAISRIGSLDLKTIAKGLGAIALYFAAVVVASKLAQGSVTGLLAFAAALAIISPALVIFGTALKLIGSIDTGTIVKGMLTIASAFAVVIAAGALAQGVALGIGVLSVAFIAFGAAAGLAGLGMAAFGAGLTAIAASGAVAFPILTNGLAGLITLIPSFIAAIGAGLVALGQTLLEGIIALTPTLVEALTTLINGLCQVVIETAPNVAEALWTMISSALTSLADHAEEISTAGWTILTTFLNGIKDNIQDVTATGGEILAGFLQGIADSIGDVVTSASNIIVNFIQGLADNIGDIVTAGANLLINFLNGIANNIGGVVTAATNVIVNFLNGIANNIPRIAEAGVNVIIAFIQAIAAQSVRIVRAAMEAILTFIRGITKAIHDYAPMLRQAGKNLLWEIINAMTGDIPRKAVQVFNSAKQIGSQMVAGIKQGFSNAWTSVSNWVTSKVNSIKTSITSALGIHSPSRVMADIFRWVPLGMVAGMERTETALFRKVDELGTKPVDILNEAMDALNDVDLEIHPTITPVLDLSEVTSSADNIQSLLDSIGATSRLAGRTRVAEDNHRSPEVVNNITNVEYNQTNTSPEAIDAGRVYRETTSLLRQRFPNTLSRI